MKKHLALGLSASLCVVILAACGGGDGGAQGAPSGASSTSSSVVASSASSSLAASLSSSSVAAQASSSVSSSIASPQIAPGSSTNPILSATEAAIFSKANYLAYSGTVGSAVTTDAWTPAASVDTSGCATGTCLTVGTGQSYTTLQAAIQAASSLRNLDRVYIKVLPGTYAGLVIVPSVSGAPAITIFGSSGNASDVQISATLDAKMTGTQYAAAYGSLFASSDHAYASYKSCADKGSSAIGTSCATVFLARPARFELAGVTVENTSPHTSATGQAVALETEGDKTHIDHVRLISRQDTFYLKTSSASTIARAYVSNAYIEGDVDFVFGRASAVFENVTFKAVSDRSSSSYVFAPSTAAKNPYGFLAVNCTFTTDSGFSGSALLGRSWDEGASSGYVAGSTPNGQLVIRDSAISAGFRGSAPWGTAATSKRVYSGNANSGRNLNDSTYNRFWQFNNAGAGAQ